MAIFRLSQFLSPLSPNCAKMFQPLNDLISGSGDSSKSISWNDYVTSVFDVVKEALANITLLVYPKQDVPTTIMTDVVFSYRLR